MVDLGSACALWQSGRDGGSSRLRAAARLITGVPHYFEADFITALEDAARESSAALDAARHLLEALPGSPCLDADEWNARVGLAPRGFAGRGLQAKPQDDQIAAALGSGVIEMPLWGVSLDPEVADSFGARWLLRIDSPFPAIPAWRASGIKPEEQELITGGRYCVERLSQLESTTVVHLRFEHLLLSGPRRTLGA